MKIKINKEQIFYLNSLDSPEAKKEFLLDQFISQCELAIAVEKDNLYKENYGSERLIAMSLAIMATKEKPNIEYIDLIVKDLNELKNAREDIGLSKENLLKFDLPKRNPNYIHQDEMESLSKEQLKDITKPPTLKRFLDEWLKDGVQVEEYGVRPINNTKLLEEFKCYEHVKILDPDKVKKYTKEDLEKCFNESRRYRIEPPNPRDRFWNTFEEYLKTNNPSN